MPSTSGLTQQLNRLSKKIVKITWLGIELGGPVTNAPMVLHGLLDSIHGSSGFFRLCELDESESAFFDQVEVDHGSEAPEKRSRIWHLP